MSAQQERKQTPLSLEARSNAAHCVLVQYPRAGSISTHAFTSSRDLADCRRGTQRFSEPVPAEGRGASRIGRASGVFDTRVAREVDAGSHEQSGVGQSVAGIVVGEKNRCLPISASGAWIVEARTNLLGWQGQLQGESREQSAGA